MARDAQNEHTLSVRERDRRYSGIRERLRENGVDCAIVNGSNLFYLSNGIAGELYGLLPAGDAAALSPREAVSIARFRT